jgi:hypothetical protein
MKVVFHIYKVGSSRSEFQHSSSTFGSGILAATVGTSSWRASPTVGNASLDDTDAVATTTFFATDGKTFVPPFNCYIHNPSHCRMTCKLVHLSLQATFFVGQTQLHQTWEDPVRATTAAPAMTRCRDVMHCVVKQLFIVVNTMDCR